VNEAVSLSAGVASLPDNPRAPLHPPDAVQLVASVDVHVSIAVPVGSTLVGFAVNETVGVGGGGGGGGEVETFTVTERPIVPPAPVQSRSKVDVVLSCADCCDPDVALLPAQAPDAAQVVAFWLLQVSVVRAPVATVVGFAEKLSVGAASRLTVTERCVVPPAPVQDKPNVAAAVNGPMLWLPFGTDFDPGQPEIPPVPLHEVASLVVQLSVLELPEATDDGLAEKLTVGAGVADCTSTVTERAALPPSVFVQVSVNVVSALSGPRVSLPLVGLLPVQPLLAVQASASVVDQVSVVLPCSCTDIGFAFSVIEGSTTPLPGLCR
jgi:hypothetical protein